MACFAWCFPPFPVRLTLSPSLPMISLRPISPGVFPVAPLGELVSLSLGNGSRFDVLCANTASGLFVAVVSSVRYGGAYVFGFAPSSSYVAEKLRLLEGDAACFADFIACQMGCAPNASTYKAQGDYAPSLCGLAC